MPHSNTFRKRCFQIISALLLTSLLAMPAFAQATLSRLVVVGDSLSAGYQNDSLLWYQQYHGYTKLIADQARTPLRLPLIAYPGIPNVLQLVSLNPLVIQPAPGQSFGRLNPLVQATDLAVPGAKVADALNTRPTFKFDNLTDFVLGLPGLFTFTKKSQVEWAEALHPTTVIMWLGSNDVLGSAAAGTDLLVTPLTDFEASYAEVMSRLAATHAKLIVANLPDATAAAYFIPAPILCAQANVPCSALGWAAGDYVVLPAAQALLAGTLHPPLPNEDVLTAQEAANLRAFTDNLNAFIASQAQAYGATLVDIHSFFNAIRINGYTVNGRTLTTLYLGGLFSLDGIHPTNTGYALLANQFITTMNASLGTHIPSVNVTAVAEHDPLVIPSLGTDALRSIGPRKMLEILKH